ncbi:concanavalin A-like lectin/glucanase domain-containing protein [Mycena rosella]|uniref:Endo-1,4-beta-xylanase n=1 Tax=Mycena rosella TaxID=1033263 RepID=A0AAD7DI97_MYCRO|nr:concanavalin A-like lectin/glucanase domain-containing protein [Mycena rosella]
MKPVTGSHFCWLKRWKINFLSCLFAFLATAAAAAVSALPKTTPARERHPSAAPTLAGYYYTFSAEDGDAVTYTNLDDSNYSIQWNDNSGYFISCKGWNPGSAQSDLPRPNSSCAYAHQTNPFVFFDTTGQLASPDRNSSLSISGWTTDPLVEYLIIESLASDVDPVLGLTLQGTVTSDGSVYNMYKTQHVNATSIMGTSTFSQCWSIRQSTRGDGFVTIANHFNAWAAVGMPLGNWGYNGSGSVEVYIGSKSAGPVSHLFWFSSLHQLTSVRVQCAAEYAQCGGHGFVGPTCCVSDTHKVFYQFSN